MADWLSEQEREELRAYNEKRYKEQHGHCITQINALKREVEQLRGNLSLAEEGLANYQQENQRLKEGLAHIKELSDGKSIAWTLAYEALNNRPYSWPRSAEPQSASHAANQDAK